MATFVEQVRHDFLGVENDDLVSENIQADDVTCQRRVRVPCDERNVSHDIPYIPFHSVNLIHGPMGLKSNMLPTMGKPGGPGGK